MTEREFKLPDLGEGLTDAEIVRWLVAVGDVVEVDQPVVEVVTAKASVELPCPFGGTVTSLHHAEGDVVDVGSPLLSIGGAPDASPTGSEGKSAEGSSGSVLVGYGTKPDRRRRRHRNQAEGAAGRAEPAEPAEPAAAADPGDPAKPAEASEPAEPAEPAAHAPRQAAGGGITVTDPARPKPAVLSPVVRRLARELGVDIDSLEGSGPEGVIVRADVERGREQRGEPAVHAADRSGPQPSQRIPIRGVRRQMADRLSRSRREIPEATVWVDVDATGILQARAAIDAANPERATGVGVTSLLARFCVLGLARFPLLNSRIEGDEIVVGRSVNLGFAAQTERGLVVPVVRDAQQLTLLELDTEIRRLAAAAREGRLTSADVTGGSFTVNNYGVFGVDGSAAIINFPEVAIVGIGRIVERPWVVDGEIRARPVTELTLAFDHRVCDGGVAGGLLRFVADCVEQPLRLLAED